MKYYNLNTEKYKFNVLSNSVNSRVIFTCEYRACELFLKSARKDDIMHTLLQLPGYKSTPAFIIYREYGCKSITSLIKYNQAYHLVLNMGCDIIRYIIVKIFILYIVE